MIADPKADRWKPVVARFGDKFYIEVDQITIGQWLGKSPAHRASTKPKATAKKAAPGVPYFKGNDKAGNEVKVEAKLNNPKGGRCQWLYRVVVNGKQLVQVDSIYYDDSAAAIVFCNQIAEQACKKKVSKEDADKKKMAHQKLKASLYDERMKDPVWNSKVQAAASAVAPETCSQDDKEGAMQGDLAIGPDANAEQASDDANGNGDSHKRGARMGSDKTEKSNVKKRPAAPSTPPSFKRPAVAPTAAAPATAAAPTAAAPTAAPAAAPSTPPQLAGTTSPSAMGQTVRTGISPPAISDSE
jgi:hypothetical protein